MRIAIGYTVCILSLPFALIVTTYLMLKPSLARAQYNV